jgi:hypothetical protein
MCARLMERLAPHVWSGHGPSVYYTPPVAHEVVVPVELSPPQVEAYRSALTRHYDVLVGTRPAR